MGTEAQPQLVAALAEFGRQVDQFLHRGAQASALGRVANRRLGSNESFQPDPAQ
jgi:hypothetical protein